MHGSVRFLIKGAAPQPAASQRRIGVHRHRPRNFAWRPTLFQRSRPAESRLVTVNVNIVVIAVNCLLFIIDDRR
jgi:hypothetical protein